MRAAKNEDLNRLRMHLFSTFSCAVITQYLEMSFVIAKFNYYTCYGKKRRNAEIDCITECILEKNVYSRPFSSRK